MGAKTHIVGEPVRVVVIDDSLTIRRWLKSVIEPDSRLDVVGMAGSAQEASEIIKITQPDVLTLDVEMPGMNGLEFLSHLMRVQPMPVVMLARGIWKNNPLAERAMKIGAAACIPKPQFPTRKSQIELCDSIYAAATGTPMERPEPKVRSSRFHNQILLIGASTGGVTAIETLLDCLDPTDIPPVVIAQHMPQQYLESFAQRLDRRGAHDVKLCRDGMQLVPGTVRIAPSRQKQTCVAWHRNSWHIREVEREPQQAYCPSVDVLFASAVPWARHVGAVLLTGLGDDGAKGMLELRREGARTLGQSKESCVVYGMPGAAAAISASEDEAPVEKLGSEILSLMLKQDKRMTAQ